MATITISSSFTNGVHTSAGVQATNNYAVIPVVWSNVDGYPELVVEQSIDDTTYFPAKVVDEFGVEFPVKLRMDRSDDKNMITVDNLLGDTPYVRIVVYQNAATAGSITYELNIG